MTQKKEEKVTVNVTVPKQAKNGKKKKNKKGKKKKNLMKSRSRETSFFLSKLSAPGLFGPFRQPRLGGSARTGLGSDVTEFTVTGSATNVVQGIQALSSFITNALTSYTATATNAAFGAGSNQIVGSQFPAPTQIADVNCTAIDILAYYTGNPLNVTGEVIFGSCIPIAPATATYASMYAYPGTLRVPCASLVNQPLRCFMRKLSPVADEFVPTNSANADVDVPFVFTSGLATGGTLVLLVSRSWEYRSTTSQGSVVTYENVGDSYSGDALNYLDSRMDLARMPSPVIPATPSIEANGVSALDAMLGYGLQGVQLGAVGAAVGVVNYARQRMARGQPTSHLGNEEVMVPFAQYLGRFANQ